VANARTDIAGCTETSIFKPVFQFGNVFNSFLYGLFEISLLVSRVQRTYLTRYEVTERGVLIIFRIYIAIIARSNSFLCLIVASICSAAISLPGR
jgi:hypothetical protein